MIYCVSDIYGNKDKFDKLMRKIHLKKSDSVFVLGNILDGEHGIDLLMDMMMQENIYPIIGEHEYAALKCLVAINKNPDPTALMKLGTDVVDKISYWVSMGGQKTIADFIKLDEENREMIIDYLSDFSLYEEIEIKGKDKSFVLVHAGINNFDPKKDLDDYDIYEFISQTPDFSKRYFDDKYLVVGHRPTRKIYFDDNPFIDPVPDGKKSQHDKIFKKNGIIAINCGSDIGGKLAALRLDDFAEFYVD